MEVILMESVDKLGAMGDTVSVARGYARNFLVPKGLAVPATDAQRKVVAQHMKLATKRDDLRKAEAEALAAKIGSLSCTITVQADDDSKLFGSVTARDIAEKLESPHTTIDHKQIVLDEAIKELGEFAVPVKLFGDVAVIATVTVAKAE
ncbi:MAG: large subunit ribosomal protein L9 [Candidatus Krumholzibacteriia bacterium]|jgi:large subunit ribosomal protein L9